MGAAKLMNRRWAAALCVLGLLSCDKQEEEQGVAPPPIVSSKPGVCAGGGKPVSDKVTREYFPPSVSGYCLDPNGDARAYGQDATGTLDEVCTQLFDGECEVYKGFGLQRVTTVRYVDGKGSPAAVSVTLSRFEDTHGAYGFFTKRVVAGGDPVQTAPKPLDVGTQGAMGTGIAYVFHGQRIVELSYTNELEPPAQIAASSAKILPEIARAIAKKLPGDEQLPAAANDLPKEHLVPLGISYQPDGVLGVRGVGRAAVGYYKDGSKRWRVVLIQRPDEDAGKDAFKTLVKELSAKRIKDSTYSSHSVELRPDGAPAAVEWVLGRNGKTLISVGDEEMVFTGGQSDEEREALRLTPEDKRKLLHRLLTGGA